jgi:hypothetical protein
VAYLSVDYHVTTSDPSFTILAWPYRDFVADLRIAAWFHEHEADNNESPWSYAEAIAGLDEIEANPKKFEERRGAGAAQTWEWMYRHSLQEDFFNTTTLGLHEIAALFGPPRTHDPSLTDVEPVLQSLSNKFATWIENSPIRLKLPRVPLRNDERSAFRHDVRQAIQSYKDKHRRILAPLVVPLGLQVLYRPPRVSFDYQKDLDNRIREIIPAVMEVFDPPPQPITPTRELPAEIKEYIGRIPKTLYPSILSYEVFELPHLPTSHADGALILGPTGGSVQRKPTWWQLDDTIEQWLKDET